MHKYLSKIIWELFDKRLLHCLQFLSRQARFRLIIISILQSSLAILDLLGVATIGVLSSLAVSGVQSKMAGGKVLRVLNVLGLGNLTLQNQVAFLGIIAATLFITRTVLSVYFTKKINRYLSFQAAHISTDIYEKMLSSKFLEISRIPTQEIVWGLSFGISQIMIGIYGSVVNILTDSFMLTLLGFGLLLVDPTVAILTFVIFTSVGLFLNKILHKRANKLGKLQSNLSIENNELISETILTFREIYVRNLGVNYRNRFERTRKDLANVLAESSFLPNISKYVIEGTVIAGSLIISAIQFYVSDAVHAISVLAIFMAAGTRIAPAVLRMQQSFLAIKNTLGSVDPTLQLASLESKNKIFSETYRSNKFDHDINVFIPQITVENLSFKFPDSNIETLKDLNFQIKEGSTFAIVGLTGSGKSTLVDVLLGIITPSKGCIKISNMSPSTCVANWPGMIGYVPQNVIVTNGNIRQNVALGIPENEIDDDQVRNALKRARLDEFVFNLENKLNESLGEKGNRLSGGQKQRLGIARALYTNPKLLILDEATSSLDGKTESEITNSLQSLAGKVTLVVIAHRLSTIRNFEKICYLEAGVIKAIGTFEEIRSSVPEFAEQASFFGL